MAQVKQGFKFELSTKGHCFLCRLPTNLIKVKTEREEELNHIDYNNQDEDNNTSPSSTPTTSFCLQDLCRNLKINMGSIANEFIKKPQLIQKIGLASTDNTSNMKVSLCQICGQITETFSRLVQEWLRIPLEIDQCLAKIHRRISNTDENPELIQSYRDMMDEDFSSLLVSEFIDELRKEILKKCLETRFSQVHVGAITANEAFSAEPSEIRASSNLQQLNPQQQQQQSSCNESLETIQMESSAADISTDSSPIVRFKREEGSSGGASVLRRFQPSTVANSFWSSSNTSFNSPAPSTSASATTAKTTLPDLPFLIVAPLQQQQQQSSRNSQNQRGSISNSSNVVVPDEDVIVLSSDSEEEDDEGAASSSHLPSTSRGGSFMTPVIVKVNGSSSSSSSAKNRRKVKRKLKYKCRICNETFPRAYDVKMHRRTEHPPPNATETDQQQQVPPNLDLPLAPAAVVIPSTDEQRHSSLSLAERRVRRSTLKRFNESDHGAMPVLEDESQNAASEPSTSSNQQQHSVERSSLESGGEPQKAKQKRKALSSSSTSSPKNKIDELNLFDKTTGKFKCRLSSCTTLFDTRKNESKHCSRFHPEYLRRRKVRKNPIKKKTRAGLRTHGEQPAISLANYAMDSSTGKYKCSDLNCTYQSTSRQNTHIHFKAYHGNNDAAQQEEENGTRGMEGEGEETSSEDDDRRTSMEVEDEADGV